MSDLLEPLVIDPPGFDIKVAWGECQEYVEDCGGLVHDDGEPNWRAAFGADPGVCSCPACDQMYWAWGRRQRCLKCGFAYETDWWCMYSWGAQARQRREPQGLYSKTHDRRMAESKYYRFAFDHACTPTMEAAKVVAWRTFFPEDVGEVP